MLGAPPQAAPFRYHQPATLAEALDLMALEGAAALAGGTDVVPLRSSGAIAPQHLVDVKHVPELRGVGRREDDVWIGATTTCAELAEGASGRELGALSDGAAVVGAGQTRARATVGGNVCRSSPAGDMLCGLLVLGAQAELRSREGGRRIPLADFFTGPGRNARADDELLVGLRLPAPAGGSAYARFTYRRSMDLAVVGVACQVSLEEGRCHTATIAIGAMAPIPRVVLGAAEALAGSRGDGDSIERAIDAVTSVATPIDDVRGSARHRLKVLRPLTRDVIARAFIRAGATP